MWCKFFLVREMGTLKLKRKSMYWWRSCLTWGKKRWRRWLEVLLSEASFLSITVSLLHVQTQIWWLPSCCLLLCKLTVFGLGGLLFWLFDIDPSKFLTSLKFLVSFRSLKFWDGGPFRSFQEFSCKWLETAAKFQRRWPCSGFKVLSNFVFLRFVVLVQDPSAALNLKPRYSFLKIKIKIWCVIFYSDYWITFFL